METDFPFEHFLKKKEPPNRPLSGQNEKINPTQIDSQNSSNPRELTHLLRSKLRKTMSDYQYINYVDDTLTIDRVEEEQIFLNLTSAFAKEILETQHHNQLKTALLEILGFNPVIHFKLIPKIDQPSNDLDKKTSKTATFNLDLNDTYETKKDLIESNYLGHISDRQEFQIHIDPKKDFTNFIVGASNNLAYASAVGVAQSPGRKYPSLYIHSSSGLGKTHLLHAIANGIKEKFPEMRICLTTAREFMKEFIEYIRNNKISDFQKKYSEHVDVLMIDDIHELQKKPATQDEFFHIFNALYHNNKQLVFTSDKPPQEIDGIEERVKTRLQWGLIVDIQKPDLETRMAILQEKARQLDLYLSDEILTLIASSIKSNIRELEGSLLRLSAYTDINNVEIDLETVKELLNIDHSEITDKLTIDHIAKNTAQYFKIHLADLKSKSRNKDIARARHIAMYLSRKLIHATQQEIGLYFGGRDHSTVINGVKKIEDQLKTDTSLSRDLFEVETKL